MAVNQTVGHDNGLRPASEVMNIQRLGAMRATSLSFLRIMLRKMMRESWKIEQTVFEMNDEGYGDALYRITTPHGHYTFVALSREISEANRSDRVISEKWDVTFALCEGDVSEQKLKKMRLELPKQEMGRGDVADLVWSRANKSERVFNHVVEALSSERQPDLDFIYEIGYLFRTTAVYGNGKFGIAPYEKIRDNHTFSGAFQAQMFAVYLLRHFSFDLAEHIARRKNPNAPSLEPEVKRLLGTGNATGLGMVPYLISHPKLLHQWMWIREMALARTKEIVPSSHDRQRLRDNLSRIQAYLSSSPVPNATLFEDPGELAGECGRLISLMEAHAESASSWRIIADVVHERSSVEAQELFNTQLIELYPHVIADLEEQTNTDDRLELVPEMTIDSLKVIIVRQYGWAFQYDFGNPEERHYFWYRSAEKEEPRIGERGVDPGDDLAMPMNIAEQVQQLSAELESCMGDQTVAGFLLKKPEFRGIVRRIQSLDGLEYGEVQSNLTAKNLLPVCLLRCKLAIFGAERFDPKSNRWVRITLFQGAPLVEEIGDGSFKDDWFYPLLPKTEEDER